MRKNNSDIPYILIADSGSTKTAWCRASFDGNSEVLYTRGINPAVQDEKTIAAVLHEDLLPQLSAGKGPSRAPQAVHFYGAGCIPSVRGRMARLLDDFIPAGTVEVESDLLGAARALYGRATGIACILGTGSNSGFYDGKAIAKHIPPLGYILGDEGSGATLGKRFAGDLLKGLLPEDISEAFTHRYGLSESDMIQKVYREPGANRFLASLTIFIHEHRMRPCISSLITSCFEDFFRRNVDAYGQTGTPVGFTGSIAYHFREELTEAARTCGYQIGKIIQSPIRSITEFHLKENGMNHAEKDF